MNPVDSAMLRSRAPLATPEMRRYFPGLTDEAGRVRPDAVRPQQSGANPANNAPRGEPAPAAGETAPTFAGGPLSSADIQREVSQDSERARLFRVAQDFQGLFVKQMLSAMRKNLDRESDPLYGGMRQQIFEDMLYDEYAKAMSKTGGFDLADQIYRQMSPALGPVNPHRASQSYDTNSNRISTGERFNETDWRP